MKTRYTPGPWEIVPQVFRGIETYKIKGPAKTGPQMIGRVEYEADARLMVESPAMYETILMLLGCADLNMEELDESSVEAIKMAQNVLARVEGKEKKP